VTPQHDVVVVGAGLAGLACAARLGRAGLDVLVLEAGDAVGGRVRTDVVDGHRCDRGFQLLNPSYPELGRLRRDGLLDVAALDLRLFGGGVAAARGGRRWVLGDPRRMPSALLSSAVAPVGSPREKLAFARWALVSGYRDVRALLETEDRSLAAGLDAAGVDGRLRRGVVETFLSGTLADADLETSERFARLLVRSFVRAVPGVPAQGMQALPAALAAALPPASLRLSAPVTAVTATSAGTDAGTVRARCVVVATDPTTAARLTGLPRPRMRSLTTFWHAADEPPTRQPLLHVDADRRGPVVNSAVLTTVAPTYAPPGRHLVASTVLGDRGDAATEREVRAHLRYLYGADPRRWDLVTTHALPRALPAVDPPLEPRRPVELDGGLVVAGDWRDTASIQGALVSGRRAAEAVLARAGRAGGVNAPAPPPSAPVPR
jgi:phytoene dehydrogenase-like protein